MDQQPSDRNDPEGFDEAADGDELDQDELDQFETPMSRLVARAKGWLAAVVVMAMILPLGAWAVEEFAFGSAGTEVEAQLGDDAALADALLLVRSSDCAGRTSTGSAFAVELDGEPVIITNRHVVEGARTIGLRPLDGGEVLRVTAHRLASSADVAVLELAEPTSAPILLETGLAVEQGDEVRIVGFPAGRPATTTGAVQEAEPGRLVLDLRVDPGASGSPVLDEHGRVVGQVHARSSDGLGIATPLAELLEAARTATSAEPCT